MSQPSQPLSRRVASLLYRLLLTAYPPRFRQDYGDEMRQVFLDCWQSASRQGRSALLRLGGRTFMDLAISAPRECLAEWQDAFSAFYGREMMKTVNAFWQVRQPGSWLETLWSLAPYGLLILLIFLPNLLVSVGVLPESWIGDGGTLVGGVVILILTCLVSFVIAWRKRWPRWSGSWLAFWLFCAFGLLSTVQQQFFQQAEAELRVLTVMILPFLIAWLIYRAACRNPMAGLLGVLPLVAVLQIIVQEFLPALTDALLNMAVLLMVCTVVIAIVRIGSWRLGFWLSAGLILVVNALGVYASHYLVVLPPEAGPHTPAALGEVAQEILIATVGVLTILIGPFLARRVRDIGFNAGLWGRLAYRMVLLGVVFLLNGLIIGPYAVQSGNRLTAIFWENNQLGEIFNGIGVFVYVFGSGLLFIAALAARQHLTWQKTILMMVLPGMLPLFFWLSLGMLGMIPSQSLGTPLLVSVGLGLVWWGLSYWLVTQDDLHGGSGIAVSTGIGR